MRSYHILHRIALVLMFVVCATAVGLFIEEKVNGADSTAGVSNTTNYAYPTGTTTLNPNTATQKAITVTSPTTENTVPTGSTTNTAIPATDRTATTTTAKATNGYCYYTVGSTVTAAPTTFCALGQSSGFKSTDAGWEWQCLGLNGGSNASCSVKRYVTPITIQVAQTVSTVQSTANTGGNSATASLDRNNTTANTTPSAKSSTASTTSNSNSVSNTTPSKTTTTSNVTSTSDNVGNNTQTTTVQNTSTTNQASGNTNAVTSDQSKAAATAQSTDSTVANSSDGSNSSTTTTSSAETSVTAQKASADLEVKIANGEVSIGNDMPVNTTVTVQVKDITTDQNPKQSGTVNKVLEVSNVSLAKKDDGQKNVTLSGKAQPNMLLTIYVFSNDPVVVTVKTDENGNWSYELDKELADGQHEAYVAVTDDSGKILAKSAPIAFVQSAEAATIVPAASLIANQSPMQKSQNQYVMIALAIVVACLVISLALIGILTYKRHFDERDY